MSFLGRQSATDMANFKFPRRELSGKLLAIASPFLLPKSSTPKAQPPFQVQPKSLITKDYPLPEFSIGDLVASDWEPDDEDPDAPDSATDFGEILGMRWLPERESCFEANTWVYYVNWTHSTTESFLYPCYDGEPTEGSALRLVNHA